MRAISASSSSGGSRHGGSGSRFPALTTLVTLAACGGIALMTAYSWSHGGGDGKLSAGDLRRRGLRTAEDAPDTASGAATNGEAAAAAAAWKAEVMDSLERLERLTKGVLKSSLQQQTATLAAATAAGAAGATAQDCTAEVAAAITSVAAAAPAAAPAQRQARPRSAIVGLAKNIDFNLLYRFVRSARQAGMRAAEVDIVLFTDAPAGDEWAWLADTYHVTLLRFDAAALPLAYRNYHPSSYRWIMIRDWMRDLPAADRYDAVFFTDVRDTIFQADVFVHTAASGPVFYAFQEARPGTIAGCGWNSGWVKDCFGQAGLDAVGRNVISCSGTSLATWAEAYAYASLVANEIAVNKCERNGVDQGMHNYFVYGGALRDAIGSALQLVANEDGWVATVQAMPTLTRDRSGAVLNAAHARYAVVHQYDRSAALKEQYDREYIWLPPEELHRK